MDDMDDWDVIYSYTRKQAIEDEVLIEIHEKLLKESGIKVPSVFTSTLFHSILKDDDPDIEFVNQLILLKEIHAGIVLEKTNSNTINFKKKVGNFIYDIRVEIGPDDNWKPCLTIGFPEDF
jgi:hypothetical protein